MAKLEVVIHVSSEGVMNVTACDLDSKRQEQWWVGGCGGERGWLWGVGCGFGCRAYNLDTMRQEQWWGGGVALHLAGWVVRVCVGVRGAASPLARSVGAAWWAALPALPAPGTLRAWRCGAPLLLL